MRLFDLFVPAAPAWASMLLLCISSLPATQGFDLIPVPPSNIDLSSLGQVVLAGDFDAISLYNYEGQTEGLNSNGSRSILTPVNNNIIASLSSADANINTMCPYVMKDGSFQGVVVGGNFTSLGGVDAQGIALFDPNTNQITPLPGVFGTVSSIYCDQETNSVYVGGSFKAANSTNAIAWVGMTGWSNLPFAGFNAPVTSITKAPSGHIVFGGSFSGLGNATTPTLKDGQVINLVTAQITSGSTTNTTGFDDPMNIVCPSDGTDGSTTTWLLADHTSGYWHATMQFGYEPTKLRLWNTNQDGRGTKIFRFTALPINGIMNLTYTDPDTGEQMYCDATCPLAHNSSNPYQDFHFVNVIGMNAFRIDISDWYGDGGGLDGVELFQDDMFAYAVKEFNEPSCANINFPSNATVTGAWSVTPSGESVSEYLSANITSASAGSTSVVFKPDIKQSGNYSVTVYTPGCVQDGTCSSRGIVNVSATLTSSSAQAFSSEIYQTNDFDKYDQVYLGFVDASTNSFRPTVTLAPAANADSVLVVASRVRFGLISSTGGLNGLFEFDPNQAVVDMDFSKSAINSAGTTLHADAQVNALITYNETIYAAGNFTDDVFENIMAFTDNNATSLPGRGLNSAVNALFSLDDFLYMGGNFTGTSTPSIEGLNNVAAYQYSTNEWVALGAGVNGLVETVVPLQLNVTPGQMETLVTFSGPFTSILASGNSPASKVSGFAVWVPSHNDWLQNLNISKDLLAGQLSAYADIPNGTHFWAGTLTSRGQAVSGAVGLEQYFGLLGLSQLPIDIKATSAASSLSKRALTEDGDVAGVVTGIYYNSGARNVTVLGGHFEATATNGSTIENLLFLNASNNNAVTGLPTGIDSNSTFLALALQGDLLFAGGSVTGEASGTSVNGLVVYNLLTTDYVTTQGLSLDGGNAVVNSVAARPGTTEVYVAGSFDQAGGLGCSSVCMYDTSKGQWNDDPGNGLSGVVSALYWSSTEKLIAAGNLTVGGTSASLAAYDVKQTSWAVISTPGIPGPVTAFAPANNDGSRIWVAGVGSNASTFLIEMDGANVRPVGDVFGVGTAIRSLQVIGLNKNHGSTPMLDNDQTLLVCGQINIPNYGNASAALFNGTTFIPFILSSTASGQPGTISQLISSATNPLGKNRPRHSTGLTILVALFSALGTLFLIILIGIILNRIQRRRAGYNSIPSAPYTDKHSNINRVPPERLFGSLGQNGGGEKAPTV